MKILIILFGGLFLLGEVCFGQDYKLDPITSKAIPTFQGTVLLVKGEARRFDSKHPDGIILEKGERLYTKDRIETSPQSLVKFQLTDQTIIALGPNSLFEIKEYNFKEINKRKALLNLIKGQLRAVIYQKAQPGDLEFRTKSIAMGVRGTEFLANEFEQTEVALLSGTLLMTNLKNQQSNELAASHYYIRSDSKTKIEMIPQAELIRLKAEHVKEEEDFRPFLERQKIENENPVSIGEKQEEEATKKMPTSLNEDDQWKKVLKQLNLRLRENHNDR